MRPVNLLPRDLSGNGRKTPPLPVLVGCIGTVLVTAVLALMFLSASSSVASKRKALLDAEAQYAALPALPTAPSVDSQIPQQTQTRVTALATALGQRVAWDRLLREVSQVVPSDVWLVTLSAQSPAVAPAAAVTTGGALPEGFTVTGCTYSQDSVARFLARLDIVPDLANMTLGKSAASSSGAEGGQCPKGMFTFTLQGNVRAAGASAS
jgi:Tfp pilus assembly protein PilN